MLEGRVEEIVEGRNGRLFLGRYPGFDIRRFLAPDPLSQSLLTRWRLKLETRARRLKSIGIPYVLLIAPDAHSVHAEELPDTLPRPHRPVGQIFAEAMGEIDNLKIIYPLQELRSAGGGLDVYKKNDSHWSAYGAFLAYRAMLDALPAGLPIRRLNARHVSFKLKPSFGDFDCKSAIPSPRLESACSRTEYAKEGYRRNRIILTSCDAAAGRVVVFRDSFFTEMAPFVRETFGHVWAVGATIRVFYDLVREVKPDVVVTELGERCLLHFECDHAELGHRELFDIDPRSAPGKLCVSVLDALRGSDKAEAAARAEALLSEPERRPVHILHAARALHTIGEDERAAELLEQVIDKAPELTSAWRLLALIALKQRRGGRWRAFAEQMIRQSPDNAFYLQEYLFGLSWFGQRRQAVERLHEAVECFSDYPSLRVLLATELQALGEVRDAFDILLPALQFFAPDTTPQILAERLRGQTAGSDRAGLPNV